MNLSLFLFLIGILGFILNRKNIILMIIAIEIMLLAVTLLVLISSLTFDDGIGQTFSIFIISIAGAESVIGLSILVAFYRLRISLFSYYLSYSNKPFVKNVNKSPLFIGKGVRNYTPIGEFIVTKIDHIIEHIIPFFEKHPILGSKLLNYLDFNSEPRSQGSSLSSFFVF